MSITYAQINKETLNHVCSLIGISASFLSQRMGQPEGKILSWLDISSDVYPTLNQAKNLANILRIPFAGLYMSKDNIPVKRPPTIRNMRSMTYSNMVDDSLMNLAVTEIIRYRDFLTSSRIEMDIEVVPISLPIIDQTLSITEYSKIIRDFFDIKLDIQFKLTSSRQFYLYVRQQVEQKGIFIHCFSGIDVETIRGFAIYDGTSPIIGINNKDRYPAKTFTIFHELVHLINRQSALCNEMYASFSTKNEEIFCNAVAGEVLVPSASLRAFLTANSINSIDLDIIGIIAKRFNISKEVITRRLLDINQFTHDVYDTYANEIRVNFLQERENEKIDRNKDGGMQRIPNISRDAVLAMYCFNRFMSYDIITMQSVRRAFL